MHDDLINIMQLAHNRGWTLGTGGNFSAVKQRGPLHLLMAPSGVDKGAVKVDDLIVVDHQGNVIKGEGKASAETALHLALVLHAGAGAVLHTHSPHATVLSLHFASQGKVGWEGYEMQKGIVGINSHDTQLELPILPNTQDMNTLSKKIAIPCSGWSYGLLLAGHGLYAWGTDLFEAKRHLEIYEFLLQVKYLQASNCLPSQ